MTARAGHWNEGMFLRPHHLQAAQRYASAHLHRSSLFDEHYNWGLRSLDIDKEALANHRLVVRALQIRLRDGTIVSVPEDGELPEINLKTAFGGESTVGVNGVHGAGRSGVPLANSERWTSRPSQRRAAPTASSVASRTLVPMPAVWWDAPSAARTRSRNSFTPASRPQTTPGARAARA